MSNPNFDPLYSTHHIWRGDDQERCLTDDLDQYDANISDLQDGKADADHAHTDYATSDHEHTEYAAAGHTHEGYADASHSHNGYAAAEHTHNGYAAETHSHSGYAASEHTHDQADVAGLEAALAGKSPTSHTHTPASMGAAPAEHTHGTDDVTGLLSALAAKADATHNHELAQIVGLVAALAAKADLVNGKIPASQLPDGVDTIVEKANLAAFPTTGASGTIYVALDTNKTYRWGGTGYVEISASLALGETASSAYRGDRGKTAYDHSQDGTVHVTAAQKTAWDGKAAGDHSHTPAAIGAAPSSHSHSYNDLTNKPTIPAAYTHPGSHPASMITGLADVATSGNYADLAGKPTIPTTLPANGGNADTVDNKHASDFATAGHKHTVIPVTTENADLNTYNIVGVYSFAAAYAPINRPEGTTNGWLVVLPWTGNTGTQTVKQIWLRHGSVNNNDHETYIRTKVGDYGWSSWAKVLTNKDMHITSDTGDVYANWTGKDVIAELKALGAGICTIYSRSGNTNNPKTYEAWRFLIHKTGLNYGWVMAFGSFGSVYSGYVDNGNFLGWRCIYDVQPDALWTGAQYMTENHTVTPSKKLSECRNGWMLVWSDYDAADGTVNDIDFATTFIPKRTPAGTTWNGQSHLVAIPRYCDSTTDTIIVKRIYAYDNKLTGNTVNDENNRNDVVLRAVYEF